MESAQQTYHGDMSASHAFIPRLGFGTFQSESHGNQHDIVKTAVLNALKVGYRHIDTAYAYGNGSVERAVGQAIRECGIPRSEIYLVTKLYVHSFFILLIQNLRQDNRPLVELLTLI